MGSKNWSISFSRPWRECWGDSHNPHIPLWGRSVERKPNIQMPGSCGDCSERPCEVSFPLGKIKGGPRCDLNIPVSPSVNSGEGSRPSRQPQGNDFLQREGSKLDAHRVQGRKQQGKRRADQGWPRGQPQPSSGLSRWDWLSFLLEAK